MYITAPKRSELVVGVMKQLLKPLKQEYDERTKWITLVSMAERREVSWV
jgi:hypothetical protein